MKTIFLMIIIAAFSSCSYQQLKDDSLMTKTAVFPNAYKIYPSDQSCSGQVKRIYLAHGFGGNKSVYDEAPFKTWMDNLRASCFQIVSYDLPYGDFRIHFKDGGHLYRKSFEQYIRVLKAEVDSSLGTADVNIAGGVSFGGLHAMMSIELTDEFDAFFALKPVTDYTALEELSDLSSAGFNVFNDFQKLAQKPGLIIYGTQDYRVDYTKTIQLMNLLNAEPSNLVSFTALDEGHASNDGNLQMILDFLNTNL